MKFSKMLTRFSQAMPASLAEVMGQEVIPELLESLFTLLAICEVWRSGETRKLDFRTFCGVCAIAERVLGAHWGLLDPLQKDPKHLVEDADFQKLQFKVKNLDSAQSTLLQLLKEIDNA